VYIATSQGDHGSRTTARWTTANCPDTGDHGDHKSRLYQDSIVSGVRVLVSQLFFREFSRKQFQAAVNIKKGIKRDNEINQIEISDSTSEKILLTLH